MTKKVPSLPFKTKKEYQEYLKQENKLVTIKLEKYLIPSLLGALELGLTCEAWCAELEQTKLNSYDTHSVKWANRVSNAITKIKKQTSITNEDTEYGHEGTLNEINKMVDKKCQYYKKNPIDTR